MSGTRRRGLGRGLDALLQPEEPQIRSLAVDRLKPNRFQPRSDFNEAGLEGLADSVRAQGVVQPIVVTPDGAGQFIIVAGERRWRAARKAGLEEVPVVVREIHDDRQILELALVENLQRSDLNPIEEAEAYRTLHESFGLTQELIGDRMGKGRSTITNALRLLALPDEIQDMLRDGRLRAGQARPLLALADEAIQLRLARRAVREGWSARRMEQRVSGAGRSRKRPVQQLDPNTAAAADRLTRRLQTRVEIRRRGAGGTIRIDFHSEEELMRLFELLNHAGGST